MTIEEFNTTRFKSGDEAIYRNLVYPISQLDFQENLIGIIMNTPGSDPGETTWVRCENIELIPR